MNSVTPGTRRKTRKLALEPLEQRDVPAYFVVMGTGDASGLIPPFPGNGSAANPFQVESLRSAVERANLTPGVADVIRFSQNLQGQTITLGDAPPLTFAAGAKTTIDGQARNVTVDGGGANRLRRVFNVNIGANAAITNIAIQNGIDTLPSGPVPDPIGGGGIRDAGTLALTGVTLTNNTSFNNFTGGGGGGLFVDTGARATLTNCVVDGNHADNATPGNNFVPGGGIANNGTLTLVNTTVRNNNATSDGAGINNQGALFVKTSTINNNSNDSGFFGASGGGIYNGGSMTLTNTTISRNKAAFTGGGVSHQGSGSASLLNCTITENITGFDFEGGGGIRVERPDVGTTFKMRNTIVSGNHNSNGDNDDIAGGFGGDERAIGDVPVTANYCLIGAFTRLALTGVGNQFNTNPMLGDLQDNGGPTFTHEPLTGSLAINLGDPNPTGLSTFDQRGPIFWRVRGGRVDIGAVEVDAGSFPSFLAFLITRARDRRYH